MDPNQWADFQEKVSFFVTLFGPFTIWFAGKFIYNKWEKRRMEVEAKRLDIQAKIDETIAQQKEADLLVVYEGMVRRASDDAISKSDKWRQLELEWSSRFDKLEARIMDQNKEIALLQNENTGLRSEITLLRSENSRLSLEVKALQDNKIVLELDNAKLKERVMILEQALRDKGIDVPRPC